MIVVAVGLIAVAGVVAAVWKFQGAPAVTTAVPNDSTTGPPIPTIATPTPTADSQTTLASAGAPKAGDTTAASAPVREPVATTNDPVRRPAAPVIDARAALDRIKGAIADPDAVDINTTAPRVLRDINRLMPSLTTRADSVEATYYAVETNLILDRPAEACRLLRSIRTRSRDTAVEGQVARLLGSAELGCDAR